MGPNGSGQGNEQWALRSVERHEGSSAMVRKSHPFVTILLPFCDKVLDLICYNRSKKFSAEVWPSRYHIGTGK
jgi:hypothetical protein